MQTVFLIGPRACGKTTLGQKLALKMGWDFIDTDQALLKKEKRSIAEIVATEGWQGFRQRESKILQEIIHADQENQPSSHSPCGCIIATGGGIVLLSENRRFLRENGLVLYLQVPAKILAARLAADPQHSQRPSLTGKGLLEEVENVLHEREKMYQETAHCTLQADQPLPVLIAEAVRQVELL